MKRSYLKLIAAAAFLVSTTVTVVSCSNDDDSIPEVELVGIAQNPDNFQGEVTSGQEVTLDATETYNLTGAVIVRDGGTLVIPAGTKVLASGGTSSYIVVEQGGKIYVNGTSSSPVVFTSNDATPGSWGGIVICGKAPINKGTSATSEVGNATYGGTVSTDNSGTLTYVRIEYAGAIYTSEKEFNGLSLFGVGSGTTISNVSVINGSDDGIEFFGGTVSVSNVVSAGNEDDAFDWTEGWTGSATNIYAKRRSDGTGNRGVEADNNSNDNDASPRSNPTIKNATFIGTTDGSESDGFKLRVGTYATIDNVVLSGWTTGFNIEHDASVSYFNGGGHITNIKFENVGTKAKAKSSAGSSVAVLDNTYTESDSATGAGSGTSVPSWASTWAGI